MERWDWGVEKKIGCEGVYLGRGGMVDFNGSACVLCYNRYSSTRGLSFEIKACGRPAILLCTTYVCAWFLARLAAWTLPSRASPHSIFGHPSSQSFRDRLSPINHLSNLFKATRLYYLGVATRFSPMVSPRGGIQKNDSGLLEGQLGLIPQLALQTFIVLRCDFRARSPG